MGSKDRHNSKNEMIATFSEDESEDQRVCVMSYEPEPQQFGNVSIVSSDNVHFGPSFYGPVTVKQIMPPPTIDPPKLPGKSGENEDNDTDKDWRRRFCPRSTKRRYVVTGVTALGFITIFIYSIILIVLSTEKSSIDDDYKNDSNQNTNGTRIYEHSVWTHRNPNGKIDHLKTPVPIVMIGHSGANECRTFDQCTETIRSIQDYHMDVMDFEDIGYNFLIGGDGQIYEGRGWDKIGSHTFGWNRNTTGICLLGDFTKVEPVPRQINATQKLMELGVRLGKISHQYRVVAQRQVQATESPGRRLFQLMTNWPHFGLQ